MSNNKCEKIQSELVAFIDGELEAATSSEIESHLAKCSFCSKQLEELKQTMGLISTMPATAPGAEFKERFEKRLRKEKASPFENFLSWLVRPRMLLGASLAACLLLIVMIVGRPGKTPTANSPELAIARHMDLFSDYEAIENLDILEDLEFIEALDEDA